MKQHQLSYLEEIATRASVDDEMAASSPSPRGAHIVTVDGHEPMQANRLTRRALRARKVLP